MANHIYVKNHFTKKCTAKVNPNYWTMYNITKEDKDTIIKCLEDHQETNELRQLIFKLKQKQIAPPVDETTTRSKIDIFTDEISKRVNKCNCIDELQDTRQLLINMHKVITDATEKRLQTLISEQYYENKRLKEELEKMKQETEKMQTLKEQMKVFLNQ